MNWHHARMLDVLNRFVDPTSGLDRLMIFVPPRNGKSELVSRRLPAYILGKMPDKSIIASSYSADLASRMNRDVQRIIDSPAYHAVFPDTLLSRSNVRTVAGSYLRNSDIFEVVGRDGVYRSAGVGGGITGMGCHFGIIDDPIKNREEADSATYREAIWEWYTSTFYTRLEKGGKVLITLTRWHEDDLAGRLLQLAQDDPQADQWTVIRFLAVADAADPSPDDPRSPGEALWPDKYDIEQLNRIKATAGPRQWEALYQQRPRPAEGAMFKRGWFEVKGAVPNAVSARVRYWDIALGASKDNDATCGLLMTRDIRGQFYIEDVQYGRWTAHERNTIIVQTAAADKATYGDVQTVIEEPPGLAKEAISTIVLALSGYSVRTDKVMRDKASRAEPLASQCEAGNVHLLAAAWNRAYLDELCAFPYGSHDDQVDATSGAFNALALRGSGTIQRVKKDNPFGGLR
jgi:predicted phage terminase large subunit-like protein